MKLVVNRMPEAPPPQAAEGDDPFAAFTSETAPPPAPPAPASGAWKWPSLAVPRIGRLARRIIIVTLSVAVLAAGGFAGFREVRARWVSTPATGLLTVSSEPAGADLLIDGVKHGVTPLTTNIPVGFHTLTIRRGEVSKVVSVTSKQDIELVQHVELSAPVATTGSLSVSSDPSGLKVAVDGKAHGVTPAVIHQLAPGAHVVSLSGKGSPTERSVVITAGGTATLMVSKPTEPVQGGVGSLAVTSPIEVQLFEGDALIGSSRATRLFLPTGRHTLTAVNDGLGFKRSISVDVRAGATAKVSVPVPNGTLSVNALPWAEVTLDGKSLGETPIGNHAVPIGTHELVFRHPQLGERRQSVVVGVGRTARVGVDLRK